MYSRLIISFLSVSCSPTDAYSLASQYDYTNWYDSFKFETVPDPTNGFVTYISQADAQDLGMAKIIGEQVYIGVDNSTVLPSSTGAGRQSIWLISNTDFKYGVLVADFAHMPGSDCSLWPAFWTINTDAPGYGEIDVIEGFSNNPYAYTTLHTKDEYSTCTFEPPADVELGTRNQDSYNCSSDIGCSVIGELGGYGTLFNENGGGVYAYEWTSELIKIWFFPRSAIPADITAGTPDPTGWGIPTANFESQYGDCDIANIFPAQSIYFDTDFCGGEAGGLAWTDYTTCSTTTGYATCEEYVASNPGAFDHAYWLVNYVKVFQ